MGRVPQVVVSVVEVYGVVLEVVEVQSQPYGLVHGYTVVSRVEV